MSDKKKIIEKNKLKVSNQNYTRLSYEMVFHDNNHTSTNLTDDDLKKALRENNKEWEKRLNEEVKTHSEENYKKGYEDGVKDSTETIERHLKPVRAAFNELNEQFSSFMGDLKPHITSLVFELTEKVLDVPMSDPELKHNVQKDINRILNELEEGVKVKIHVSADDYDAFGEMIGAGNKKNEVSIIVDEQIKPGEYKIETAFEMILRDFKQVLKDIKKSITLNNMEDRNYDVGTHQ